MAPREGVTVTFGSSRLTKRRVRRGVAWIAAAVCLAMVLPGTARADNPIVQTIYTADPAPLVYNGRVYLYTGHDEDGSTNFTMKEWRGWGAAPPVGWGAPRPPPQPGPPHLGGDPPPAAAAPPRPPASNLG